MIVILIVNDRYFRVFVMDFTGLVINTKGLISVAVGEF